MKLTADEVTGAITAYAKKFAAINTKLIYDEVNGRHEAVVIFEREEGNARKD